MKYKLSASRDSNLKSLEKAHEEFCESDYPIKEGDLIYFKDLSGLFKCSGVVIDIREDIILILCVPRV